MPNLYQIDEAIRKVIDGADENGEMNLEALDQLQLAKADKQLNVIKYIKHFENDEQLIDQELERLKKLKGYAANRTESLKKYLENSMRIDGITELDFTTHKAKFKQNPASVVITDESLVPDKFIKTEVVTKVDKKAIGTALKLGDEVPGCTLLKSERLSIN